MKSIWKYQIDTTTVVDMPEGAEILAVQIQAGVPQLWAVVDPAVQTERRTFVVHGTGHELPDKPGRYVGTFQMHGGALVLHVFETSTPITD